MLSTYRFLIDWHYHNLESHNSWLEPRYPPGVPWYARFRDSFVIFGPKRRPMAIIHNLLIGANAIIIAGGSQLAGGTKNQDLSTVLAKSKVLRTVGQSIFLSINAFLFFCIIYTVHQCRRQQSGKIHPTLLVLLAVWPLLFVRGIYGILSGVLPAFNYFNPNNYGAVGLKDSFVVSEYILATTMEWTSCALLMLTYITSLGEQPLEPLRNDGETEMKPIVP